MEDYEWSLAVVVLTTNSYCFSLYIALNTLNYSLHDYHLYLILLLMAGIMSYSFLCHLKLPCREHIRLPEIFVKWVMNKQFIEWMNEKNNYNWNSELSLNSKSYPTIRSELPGIFPQSPFMLSVIPLCPWQNIELCFLHLIAYYSHWSI